jgi:hypothetical protein
VVSNNSLLFASTSRYGSHPFENAGKAAIFSDLYIPSYTPSLSALIESRKASPQTLLVEKPSLLLVAQPDGSLPGVTGEIEVILERALKARVAVTSLVSSGATPSTVFEGLRGSQLTHFACHGVLETGKPFQASFKLRKGERLTLLKYCPFSTSGRRIRLPFLLSCRRNHCGKRFR